MCVFVHVCVHACVCVSPSPRLIMSSGIIWTQRYCFKKFYSIYVAAVVIIISTHGLSIDECLENQPNKRKLALYNLSILFNSSLKQLYISSETECFSYKGRYGMTHTKAFKRRANFGHICISGIGLLAI